METKNANPQTYLSAQPFSPAADVAQENEPLIANRYAPIILENLFADVAYDACYYKAVLWAVEEGMTTGMVCPDASCTRAQIVTFLWRQFVE